MVAIFTKSRLGAYNDNVNSLQDLTSHYLRGPCFWFTTDHADVKDYWHFSVRISPDYFNYPKRLGTLKTGFYYYGSQVEADNAKEAFLKVCKAAGPNNFNAYEIQVVHRHLPQ